MSSKRRHFYQFGPFRLDPLKRRLMRDGEPVPLTPKAFDTLLALVQQSGKTIEKDDLIKQVWVDAVVEENNLNQNITALRKTLGDSRHESRYIATVPGFGYRFVADVSEVEETPSPVAAIEETAQPVFLQQASVTPASPETNTRVSNRISNASLRRRSLLILTPLVLAAFVYVLYTRKDQPSLPRSISSIAVLPLENLSGDPAEEYFADGMTDALIGDLANFAELRIISRTSSMSYKGTKKSLPEIAGELKVDAVVEGTVQRSGERVRVRVQLIQAATDRHLWVQIYEREMRDVLDLHSEIAQSIAREVHVKTTPAEQARLSPRRPVHPKAFDDYLQGRYLFWNKRTEENLGKAIEYFQSAIKVEPTYARAYVGLADCYNGLGSVQFGALAPVESRQRAEEAALKALELDGRLAEAHSALGFVKHYSWDWVAAEREFKLAIELNPNYANAHNLYAGYLSSMGRVEESLAASARARELDPLSLSISAHRSFLLGNARRYDEAIEQFRRVIAMDQNHEQAYWGISHIYVYKGQLDEAVAAAERVVSLSGRAPSALGMLGLVYGLAGRRSEAVKVLSELLELSARRYVTPAVVAYVYIGLGDKDQAFVWLEKSYQQRSNYIVWLKVHPIVDSLRSDPRFDDLIRRVGLPL